MGGECLAFKQERPEGGQKHEGGVVVVVVYTSLLGQSPVDSSVKENSGTPCMPTEDVTHEEG